MTLSQVLLPLARVALPVTRGVLAFLFANARHAQVKHARNDSQPAVGEGGGV